MKKIALVFSFIMLFISQIVAQEYKHNIYVYYPHKMGAYCWFIENKDELVATICNNYSYIVFKSNSDDLSLKTTLGLGSYEGVKTDKSRKWNTYSNKLSPAIKDYYIEISNANILVNKTKADFDKRVNKLTFSGEYILEDPHKDLIANNYQVQQQQYHQQPQYIQSQPVVNQPVQSTTPEVPISDVDVNIPQTNTKSTNTFVLIIANEHYTFVDDVDCAIHDGEIFKEYCVKTLGVPERQVWFYKDASAGIISGGVDKMVQAMSLFENSKAIVYYCGHGIPDEHTGDAYIVPTDGKGTNTATCYSLNKLYTTLAASNATSVTYFMDACFSGANKEGSMLVAARGVAREPKKEKLGGNTVVFSAASGDETAMTFKEQGHGLFTYYLLKKLQETQGDVSYEDLDKYIKANVKRESFLTNEKVQTPTTNVSENAIESWKGMRLK